MMVKHSIWRSPRFKGIAIFVPFLCTFNVGIALGSISTVEVIPANPSTQDSVRIRVAGSFNDACWSISGQTCSPQNGLQIAIDIVANDLWVPGKGCPTVVVDYAFTCDYGELQMGHYAVTVTENHNSLREPQPDIVIVEFDVTLGPNPVEITTWGRIKALFR